MTDRYLCQSGIPAPPGTCFRRGRCSRGTGPVPRCCTSPSLVCRHATCRLATLFQAILGYPKAALTGPAADICMQNGTVRPVGISAIIGRRENKTAGQAFCLSGRVDYSIFIGVFVMYRSKGYSSIVR